MNMTPITKNCEKCLNNCNGHCTAFIFSTETKIEKCGCPAYVDENTKWRIAIWKDKE